MVIFSPGPTLTGQSLNDHLHKTFYTLHVCGKAKKYAAKARKFFTTAQKSPAKFNVFGLRRSLLEPGFDVYLSLQVKPRCMFDFVAFSFDLHNRNHVKPLELLLSFCFKLPSIRGLLLNLIDDHVKHVFEHVKLCRKLPCSGAIVLCLVTDITEPSAVAPGQSLPAFVSGKLTRRYRARFC